jgi:primosomal protein N' (replication factor Y)
MAFAEIIIPLALPKNFTWEIPDSMADAVQVGVRVEVELGNKKRYAGLVKRILPKLEENFKCKSILNVLDKVPIISEQQFNFWTWLASYYMCSEGEVMQAALPSHFKLTSETVLEFNEEAELDVHELSDEAFLVAEALQIRKQLLLQEIQQILEINHVYPVIKQLIDLRICLVQETLKESFKEKKEKFVFLDSAFRSEAALEQLINAWTHSPKQLDILLAYLALEKNKEEVVQSELLKKSNASLAQLKALEQKGILRVEKRTVGRLPIYPKNIQIDFTLSEAQQKALYEIQQVFLQQDVCLLHGVTGSGKTQLYIDRIAHALQEGKQVLFLLPEIALTAQIIRRLQVHFGGHISVYHSKFNPNERIEIWNKVRSGETSIVLGARSALFLPFLQLGLIICDEEHDPSYKQQDPAPRYHGRDAAVFLAHLSGAKVLLGSATPSLESYHQAKSGKYGLVELKERFGEGELPEIELINTRGWYQKQEGRVVLSPPLQEAMKEALAAGKQIILFQNRRGYSPYQLCSSCGHIPQCKNCNVSLTYHKFQHKLHCHYCGTVYPPVHVCERCGNHDFSQRNFGTERIEEEVLQLFPDAQVARMDMDSVRGKNAHDQLIQRIEQKKIDILIGTQMVVKGLDFEEVQLVGILDGDGILGFADFRVNERAFQLMEQVSGRAGRKDDNGKVLIQVTNQAHPILEMVQSHQFALLYQFEIPQREAFGYPPFTRMIYLTLKHRDQHTVERAAVELAALLKPGTNDWMIGPSEPVVNRIRNLYIREITLKIPRSFTQLGKLKTFILDRIALLHQNKSFRSVLITPDVDPV